MVRIATLADKRAVEARDAVGASAGRRARSTSSWPRPRARFPDRPAITFQLRSGPRDKAVTLTWAEFRAEVTRAANLFRRLGVGPADTVAYVLPNGIEAPVALLAGATAGIVNPINPLLAPEHIAGILRDTRRQGRGDAGAVPEDRPRAEGRRGGGAGARASRRCSQVDLARYLAPPLAWIVPLIRPKLAAGAPGARARPRAARWRRENGAALDFAETLDDRVCAYFHTGGTTGLPKVAQHRASGILYNGWCGAVLHLHRGGRADVPAADVPRLRRLSDPDVLPDDRGADGDADAAGLSRRRGDGQLLEADRAPPGHLPDHRADRGRGADAAQGRRRRLDAAARDQRLGGDAGRALPPLRGGDRRQGARGLRHDRGDLPRRDQPALRRAQDRQRRPSLPLHRRARSCTATPTGAILQGMRAPTRSARSA